MANTYFFDCLPPPPPRTITTTKIKISATILMSNENAPLF